MNDSQRIKLQEMIDVNDTINHTEEIRQLNHSSLIRKDVVKIQQTKRKLKTTHYKTLDNVLQSECFFLFQNYTLIYNKLLKNDLDVTILYTFLDVLESIENGNRDQHEASYEIGTLLKKIYIDKKIEDAPQTNFISPVENISWKEYYAKKLI
ncbi:hypothetical protein 162324582 [Organic Lake phycodnavirus 2]|jgi:hypothetical protein|nr:hypothetical protein 162324582 [Organic Lake phycodnavirus 2]